MINCFFKQLSCFGMLITVHVQFRLLPDCDQFNVWHFEFVGFE